MSEGTLLAIISGPLVLGIISAVGYIWRQRDKIYERQIETMEKELLALRSRITELQDKALDNLREQLVEARRRVETDTRMASTIEAQAVGFSKLAGSAHDVLEAAKAKSAA